MEKLDTNFLFVEKYRPKNINDTILPENIKSIFQKFVKNKNIPNLLLVGKAGVGKTTVAKAMLNELGCDYMVINGSMNGNIDTLRNDIQQFASSVSFSPGRKYVILDEADYLNPNSTQPALRNFMEEYSKNAGFIFTANYKNKIIEPLQSRCSLVEFIIPKEERKRIASEIYSRVEYILNEEHIKFEPDVLKKYVIKYFPDFRRTINEVQYKSSSGVLSSDFSDSLDDGKFKELMGFMKAKNFSEMRKWVALADISHNDLFRKMYDESTAYLKSSSIPQLVLIVSKYQYQSSFANDQEINTVACLTEIMADCVFI